jgi:hypothetical protein
MNLLIAGGIEQSRLGDESDCTAIKKFFAVLRRCLKTIPFRLTPSRQKKARVYHKRGLLLQKSLFIEADNRSARERRPAGRN